MAVIQARCPMCGQFKPLVPASVTGFGAGMVCVQCRDKMTPVKLPNEVKK